MSPKISPIFLRNDPLPKNCSVTSSCITGGTETPLFCILSSWPVDLVTKALCFGQGETDTKIQHHHTAQMGYYDLYRCAVPPQTGQTSPSHVCDLDSPPCLLLFFTKSILKPTLPWFTFVTMI